MWEYKEINTEIDNNNFKIIDAQLSNVQLVLKIESNENINLSDFNYDSIKIWDEKNIRFIVPENMIIIDKNIIYVNYNINSNMFSNIIKGKIKENQDFYLEKII